MKRKIIASTFYFLFISLFLQAQVISIIPKPVELKVGKGTFTIDGTTSIYLANSPEQLKPAAAFLSSYISNISGLSLRVNKRGGLNKIVLSLDQHLKLGDEGYKLLVTPTSIHISANTKAGILYGMQSLFQTLPQVRTNAALKVPAMEVTDYPRFKWRGMHMDVSRHFFPFEIVKQYIDLLASYKLNYFHWHLIDDQGWRLEIKRYPELTKVGAWRVDHNNIPWNDRPQAKPGEPATYGGFYTQEQVKEIVAYAEERNVTVVPEIEMPAHVASVIAAYPHLACFNKPQLPLTGGNYKDIASNYCAGNEEVYKFLENVLDEVITLFPSRYIHIGGDELDKTNWKKCPKCQSRMKTEGLKNEEELQSYFITRMEKYLISRKRNMIGWDEILEGGLAPEATVMSWRGEAGGVAAARMKHDVIMTPGNPLYFDNYQAGPEGEPLAIGGFNTLKKVYDYDPIPKELSSEDAKYVLGAQANLWAEFITTTSHLQYMLLPRLLALAEIVWTPKEVKNWPDFNKRLVYHCKGFDLKGINYSPGNYKVDIKPEIKNGRLSVILSTEIENADIYYTTDGSAPSLQSKKYTNLLNIDTSVTIKASTAIKGKLMGVQPAVQTFVIHKATGKDVSYTNPVSSYYQANGPNTLTDGVKGTKTVGLYWHGFSGKPLIATVDLGTQQLISSVSLGFLQNYSDWIFLPPFVKFEISKDGKNYEEIGLIKNDISLDNTSAIKDFTARFSKQNARYIRVSAPNNICPKGHNGEGKPAWLFADELVVD